MAKSLLVRFVLPGGGEPVGMRPQRVRIAGRMGIFLALVLGASSTSVGTAAAGDVATVRLTESSICHLYQPASGNSGVARVQKEPSSPLGDEFERFTATVVARLEPGEYAISIAGIYTDEAGSEQGCGYSSHYFTVTGRGATRVATVTDQSKTLQPDEHLLALRYVQVFILPIGSNEGLVSPYVSI